MHRIKKIKVAGFRRLYDVEIEIEKRPFMVMIGANGVGKTSVLDAISLLSASASGNLNHALSELGGITSVLTRGRCDEICFEVEMDVPNYYPLIYELHLTQTGTSYRIRKEMLSQSHEDYPDPFKHIDSFNDNVRYFNPEKNRLVPPSWDYDPYESSLAQVPKMFQQPEVLRQTLCSVTKYHALDVGPRALVKLPQQLKPAPLPGENGENLIPFLFNLMSTNEERFEAILDTLKVAFPGFERLTFPPVAAGMLSLAWKERNFTEPIYIHQLSEGTLRFLWLISLLHSPNLSTITMIDEPEVSLHPELLCLLADLMRNASERTQIIVATHSDRLIRFLSPEEVMVMDVAEDGCATMTWADKMDLEGWLKDYSLDEIWRMGRMGGAS